MAREFDDRTLELVAERFKVLCEPTRLRILNCLREGERTVSGIVEETGEGQPNVSRHLGILLRHRMVHRRREGVYVHYRIADPYLFRLCEMVCRSAEAASGPVPGIGGRADRAGAGGTAGRRGAGAGNASRGGDRPPSTSPDSPG